MALLDELAERGKGALPPEQRFDVAPALGHWFAGFTDGEGCFYMRRATKGNAFVCSFHVKLRADDRDVLEAICELVGHGKVSDVPRYSPTRAPQAVFVVSTITGCSRIVDIFDEFPLRSKKARDYAVWRDAVIFWISASGSRGTDWSEMEGYYDALRSGRKYPEEAA